MATYKFIAKDLMSEKVVCVKPETPVPDLIKILVKNRIHGVPVVNKEGKLVGVVSKTDIVEYDKTVGKKQKTGVRHSFYRDDGGNGNGKLTKAVDESVKAKDLGKATVKDIMTPRVITAQTTDTVDRLAKIMYEEKIHRVVILEKGRVAGVVSTLDILHAVSTMGYGSSAFVTDEAILDLRERLEEAEKSIQSLLDILSKIHGEK